MHLSELKKTRKKLEEMGVDKKILDYIDQLSTEDQQGIYHFFLEIMNDELVFIIALKDQSFTERYLKERENLQPLTLN